MFDLIVIGSGASGIYATYLAHMHNLKTKIIEASSEIGGQMLLFKDKPVYDMPGFLNVNGKDILKSFKKQLNQTNIRISKNEKLLDISGKCFDFTVTTSISKYKSKFIILSTGGGLFQPIKLNIDSEDKYKNIDYFIEKAESYKNKNIIIFGGGDTALDWANYLEKIANKITLIHRRNEFRAQESMINKIKEKIDIYTPYKFDRINKVINEKITEIYIKNIKTKETELVHCDNILVFFGQMKILDKNQIFNLKVKNNMYEVNTRMETSREGIFAIGNIATYEGKVKMLVTGLGEAATAVGSVVEKIFPGKKMTYLSNK